MSGTITQPPKADPALITLAGRRRKLVGKTVDQVVEMTRGYRVTFTYPDDIGVRIGEKGRVEAVW